MNGLLCGGCGHKRLVWSGTLDNHCSGMTMTVIRTTGTAATSHDRSNDRDEHQTADNNAYDAPSREVVRTIIAVGTV